MFLFRVSLLPGLCVLQTLRLLGFGDHGLLLGAAVTVILLLAVGKAHTWACGVKVPMAIRLRG